MKLRLTTVCCNFDVSRQCEIIPNYFSAAKTSGGEIRAKFARFFAPDDDEKNRFSCLQTTLQIWRRDLDRKTTMKMT